MLELIVPAPTTRLCPFHMQGRTDEELHAAADGNHRLSTHDNNNTNNDGDDNDNQREAFVPVPFATEAAARMNRQPPFPRHDEQAGRLGSKKRRSPDQDDMKAGGITSIAAAGGSDVDIHRTFDPRSAIGDASDGHMERGEQMMMKDGNKPVGTEVKSSESLSLQQRLPQQQRANHAEAVHGTRRDDERAQLDLMTGSPRVLSSRAHADVSARDPYSPSLLKRRRHEAHTQVVDDAKGGYDSDRAAGMHNIRDPPGAIAGYPWSRAGVGVGIDGDPSAMVGRHDMHADPAYYLHGGPTMSADPRLHQESRVHHATMHDDRRQESLYNPPQYTSPRLPSSRRHLDETYPRPGAGADADPAQQYPPLHPQHHYPHSNAIQPYNRYHYQDKQHSAYPREAFYEQSQHMHHHLADYHLRSGPVDPAYFLVDPRTGATNDNAQHAMPWAQVAQSLGPPFSSARHHRHQHPGRPHESPGAGEEGAYPERADSAMAPSFQRGQDYPAVDDSIHFVPGHSRPRSHSSASVHPLAPQSSHHPAFPAGLSSSRASRAAWADEAAVMAAMSSTRTSAVDDQESRSARAMDWPSAAAANGGDVGGNNSSRQQDLAMVSAAFQPPYGYMPSARREHHTELRATDPDALNRMVTSLLPLPSIESTMIPLYTDRTPIPLAADEDHNWLSEFLCFVRMELVEIFRASMLDVRTRNSSKKVTHGQVGIRCRFCAHMKMNARASRSSSFPSSLSRIYQSLTMMLRDHFGKCTAIPSSLRHRFLELKAKTSQGATDSKHYWVYAAMKRGLVDSEYGIWINEDPNALGAHPLPFDGASTLTSEQMLDRLAHSSRPAAETDLPMLLVDPDDKPLVPEFLYEFMTQVQRVELQQVERTGNRKTLPLGLAGIACRHCCELNRMGLCRIFPGRRRTLPSKLTDLWDHVRRCPLCPSDVRMQLTYLHGFVVGDEISGRRPGEKEFYDRIWKRLGHQAPSGLTKTTED